MDTGFLSVASIWFQWVMPMPLASGPMITWPTFSPRPSSVLSATVTLKDSSCREEAHRAATCRTREGTEKIMASLKIGLVSSRLVDVFFLLIFLPSCRSQALKGLKVRSRSESLSSASPALRFLSSVSMPKAAKRRLYSSRDAASRGMEKRSRKTGDMEKRTERCRTYSAVGIGRRRFGLGFGPREVAVKSPIRDTRMKQPGKSPSSRSSRSLPWCSVTCSSPWCAWACRDGSNSSVTSS
ncbi:hypothetical protein CRUP_023663 [Coryphaenoides rupestris]|nr:hypothetical protein CRUP_023663 [Coryphaenoides rupestris]